MPAIGITGGISTGKSTFCQCLREILAGSARCADRTAQRAVPTATFFDADQAAHQLVDLDSQVKKEIAGEFGAEIFSGGDLNRKRLRAIIFEDAAKKRALEKILHPRIRRQWSVEANKHRQSSDFFFADIPLLYETGGETLCDRVVVVACSTGIQLASLLARGGMERIAAEEMIKAQMPLEEKIRKADHVVWNNGDRSVLKDQAEKLVEVWCQEKWTKA